MQQSLSLAILALAPLASARFGRFDARSAAQDCPPCVCTEQPQPEPVTVTVTHTPQNATPSTVTVEKSVPAEPSTVYVTASQEPPAEETTVVVQPTPSAEGPRTVTVINGSTQQQEVVTKVIQPSGGNGEEQTAEPSPSVVIVTLQPPSHSNEPPSVVTKTVGQQNKEPHTVYVSLSPPEVKTVTLNNGEESTISAPASTITAPPTEQTPVQSMDQYTTVTKTVGNGPDNINIIIINIINGVMSCTKKHSGKPCHPGNISINPPGMSTTYCPPVNTTTSVATAYNTIFMTAGSSVVPMINSTTAGMPSGTGNMMPGSTGNVGSSGNMMMGRVPRVPIRRHW